MRLVHLGTATAIVLASAAPAFAQYRQAQPQYQPMVAPATQASVANLDNRIVTLERQIADLLRVGEENAHRIGQLEAELKQQKDDSAARIAALEAQLAAGTPAAVQSAASEVEEQKPVQAVASTSSKPKPINAVVTSDSATDDPAEEAYDAGYQLWKAGKYDEAVGALRAFSSAYPKHRRTSWANNLTGRALLDKGEPRAAAEVLLANYRANPKGERAADSLFYLGQSLMKLDQGSQACKAYAELEAVYGSSMRADLQKQLPAAKSQAKCG
jgi:TolA-binding protein